VCRPEGVVEAQEGRGGTVVEHGAQEGNPLP